MNRSLFRVVKSLKSKDPPKMNAFSKRRTCASKLLSAKYTSQELIKMEETYSAHNYHPFPVVFSQARGAVVRNPEGKNFLDFLSAYSAVNQGHVHPRIKKVAIDQLSRVTLSCRAFHNDRFPLFAKYITDYFGYEKVLPMNTGAEGVETAVKLCRKWAYTRGPCQRHKNEGVILVASGNFHGRTTTIVSFSDDPDSKKNYGPFTPGFVEVPYGDAKALRRVAERYKNKLCGIMIEPIQGEAGVIVPPSGYLEAVQEVCRENHALFIVDEVQTGIARTGKLLAHHYENVRPDIVVLGKALSGGFYPVSAVLADDHVMGCLAPGTHGSTFGGNPLGSAIAMESLQVITDEELTEKAFHLGNMFREHLAHLPGYKQVKEVRGKGLLNAIEFNNSAGSGAKLAYDVCTVMREHGVLAKPTHGHIIRFSPPLVITDRQMRQATTVISKAFHKVLKAN